MFGGLSTFIRLKLEFKYLSSYKIFIVLSCFTRVLVVLTLDGSSMTTRDFLLWLGDPEGRTKDEVCRSGKFRYEEEGR